MKKRPGTKLIAAILIVLMAASMIAACSGDASPSSSPGGAGNSPAASGGGSSPAASSSAAPGNSAGPADTGPVKLVFFKSGATPEQWEVDFVYPRLLEAGWDIEIVYSAQGEPQRERINLMFAARETLDFFESYGNYDQYVANGLLQPLEDLIDLYGQDIRNLHTVPQEIWNALSSQGHIWALPRNGPLAGTTFLIKKDWMDMCGITKVPGTIAEIENALQKFLDMKPGGEETIPLVSTPWGLHTALAAGFTGAAVNGLPGGSYCVMPDDSVLHAVLVPGYRDFVAKIAEWYARGFYHQETFTLNYTTARELISKEIVGATLDWVSVTSLSGYSNVTYPLDPVNNAYLWNSNGIMGPAGLCETIPGFARSGYVVPKFSDKAAEVVQYLNWLAQDPANYALGRGFHIAEDGNSEWIDQFAPVKTYKLKDGFDQFLLAQGFYQVPGGVYEYLAVRLDETGVAHMHTQMCIVDGMLTQYNRGQGDMAWKVSLDQSLIIDEFPMYTDVSTMLDENLMKFYMGVRPMSEWDAFVSEMKQMGVEQMSAFITQMYREALAG